MPVYGKALIDEGNERKGTKRESNVLYPLDAQSTFYFSGKSGQVRALLGPIVRYSEEDQTLDMMNKRLPVSNTIDDMIAAGDKNPLIVEWGCARATGITQLAEAYPTATCVGYSREFYDEWKNNRSVYLVHEPTGDLKNHLKDNSVSVMIASHSLSNLYEEPELYRNEVEGLIPKLKIGGKMLIDQMPPVLFNELKQREQDKGDIAVSGMNISDTVIRIIIQRKESLN